jgi:hypothetical protein
MLSKKSFTTKKLESGGGWIEYAMAVITVAAYSIQLSHFPVFDFL